MPRGSAAGGKRQTGLAATDTSLMSMKRRIQENGREQNELLDCLLENMNNAEPNAKMQTLSDEQQTPKEQVEAAQQTENTLREPPNVGERSVSRPWLYRI